MSTVQRSYKLTVTQIPTRSKEILSNFHIHLPLLEDDQLLGMYKVKEQLQPTGKYSSEYFFLKNWTIKSQCQVIRYFKGNICLHCWTRLMTCWVLECLCHLLRGNSTLTIMLSEGMPLSFAWRQFNTRDQYSQSCIASKSQCNTQSLPTNGRKIGHNETKLTPTEKMIYTSEDWGNIGDYL